jgi:hypothetical protein
VWFVPLRLFRAIGVVEGWHPGLFHFVALRPYNGMEEAQMLQKKASDNSRGAMQRSGISPGVPVPIPTLRFAPLTSLYEAYNVSIKHMQGCTQASETTLYEYTRMMVIATWAPRDLKIVDVQYSKIVSCRGVPWQ